MDQQTNFAAYHRPLIGPLAVSGRRFSARELTDIA